MSLITGPNSQPNPNKPDTAAGGGSKIIVDSDWKSQAQAEKEKLNAQAQAAAQAKRNVRIIHQLSQAPDHPVSIYHPEGEYLKGLVMIVD